MHRAFRDRAGGSASAGSPGAGTMWMQSTGQAGTQSSQPLQSAAMTVCMRLRAPTIASVGQGGRQRAQPMQAGSSIQATRGGPSAPQAGSSGQRRPVEQGRELRDQRRSARRAAIELRLAAGERLGIRPAGVEAAAAALGLRQERVDAPGEFVRGGHAGPQLTFMPALAPASGERRKSPSSPEAASAMPSEVPKRIFFGLRFATITTWRPTSAAGS